MKWRRRGSRVIKKPWCCLGSVTTKVRLSCICYAIARESFQKQCLQVKDEKQDSTMVGDLEREERDDKV